VLFSLSNTQLKTYQVHVGETFLSVCKTIHSLQYTFLRICRIGKNIMKQNKNLKSLMYQNMQVWQNFNISYILVMQRLGLLNLLAKQDQ